MFVLVFSVACNSDDDNADPCENWNASVAFEAELNALTTAATAYGNDPTTENCLEYKAAYVAYLDAVRNWEDCYVFHGQREEFLQAVADAEAQIMTLQC